MTSQQQNLIIVEASALPAIFLKVLEAKRLLATGQQRTIQDACRRLGISRSAFYKYKDLVFAFYENTRGRTVTFAMNLEDRPGLLSEVLDRVAASDSNVLTINQTIPLGGVANVTITVETGGNGQFFEEIQQLPGVLSLKILARE